MIDPIPPTTTAPVSQVKDSTLAIVSLIGGIVTWTVIPILGAIVAIITGHMAKSEIKKSAGMLKGNGMATAGLILGYVQIGFMVLGLCAFLFLLPTLGASISDVFSQINSGLY